MKYCFINYFFLIWEKPYVHIIKHWNNKKNAYNGKSLSVLGALISFSQIYIFWKDIFHKHQTNKTQENKERGKKEEREGKIEGERKRERRRERNQDRDNMGENQNKLFL